MTKGLIERAIELYNATGRVMHWFDFYIWGRDNERYGFQKYIDKALQEKSK